MERSAADNADQLLQVSGQAAERGVDIIGEAARIARESGMVGNVDSATSATPTPPAMERPRNGFGRWGS